MKVCLMEYPPVGEAGGEWDKSCEGIKQGDAPRRGTGQGTRHDEEPGGDTPRRETRWEQQGAG